MTEPKQTPESNLSDAGKLRRQQILQGLKTELAQSCKRRRRRKVMLGSAAMLFVVAGISWFYLPNDSLQVLDRLAQNPKTTPEESPGQATQQSRFRPQVVSNHAKIDDMIVTSRNHPETTQVQFLSIETEELDDLLTESGKTYVIGRIGGELRVLFPDKNKTPQLPNSRPEPTL